MDQSLVLGIDIGGTNTKFGVVDSTGHILSQGSIVTCENADPHHFIDRLAIAVEPLFKKYGKDHFLGIGVGAPNGNFYTGTIELAPNLQWRGIVPLVNLLEKKFDLKATLTNDANAAAIGEMMYGHAKGMTNFIVITLGTGLGSGIVINGDLVYGHTGFAGELGHVTVIPHGRLCGCERKGCLETYASATGIVKTVKELLHQSSKPSTLREMSEEKINAKHITEADLQGDSIALEAYDFTAQILARALADAVAFSSPEAIFLFGGLTQAKDVLFKPTKEYFEKSVMNVFKNKVKLLPSGLPESDAAILGAAALITSKR
jgi:glucokinase